MKTNFDFILSEQQGFKIVGIYFDGNPCQIYHYKTFIDLKEDDKVLVPVGDKGGFGVGNVGCILKYADYYTKRTYNGNIKWVVQKIDFTGYSNMHTLEAKLEYTEQKMRQRHLLETFLMDEDVKLILLDNAKEVK